MKRQNKKLDSLSGTSILPSVGKHSIFINSVQIDRLEKQYEVV